MCFYWQLSCPLLFCILALLWLHTIFLFPTTMNSPLSHSQHLSLLLHHPLTPSVNLPSADCFSLPNSTYKFFTCQYDARSSRRHGKTLGRSKHILHTCYSELHKALEIGVSRTIFKWRRAHSVPTSTWSLCASEVQDLCKAEHLHYSVSDFILLQWHISKASQ